VEGGKNQPRGTLYSGTDLREENDLPLETYGAAKLTQVVGDIYDKQFESCLSSQRHINMATSQLKHVRNISISTTLQSMNMYCIVYITLK
jgi:hypothetical protein